uniref:Uncharacterized protein n=1 Tax=Thermosporothrix sp. COM3 TaxID=2490863 RepID=A0A455SK19_9CHLR|nr:hypothetical protein KTC_20600 [Thermosporothrix sp. COM3]
MRFIGATEVSTDTACQLMDREQTSRLNDGTLAMHPFGFDGVEPRALFGQKQGQDAHAFVRLLDLLVLFSDPGSHQLRDMPRSVIPDQEPMVFALLLQSLTTPLKKLGGDG